MKIEWVKCPVCEEPDMQKVTADGESLITCTNTRCLSNDGSICFNGYRGLGRIFEAIADTCSDIGMQYKKSRLEATISHHTTAPLIKLTYVCDLDAVACADATDRLIQKLVERNLDRTFVQATFSALSAFSTDEPEEPPAAVSTIASLAGASGRSPQWVNSTLSRMFLRDFHVTDRVPLKETAVALLTLAFVQEQELEKLRERLNKIHHITQE